MNVFNETYGSRHATAIHSNVLLLYIYLVNVPEDTYALYGIGNEK